MAKGFIRGVLWGAGFSFGTVTLLSLVSGDPQQTQGNVTAQNATTQSATAPGSNLSKDASGPSAAGLATTEVPAPEPDTLAALLAETLAPAAVPQTGAASDMEQTAAPQSSALAGIASTNSQGPEVRSAGSAALTTPATEPEFSISTEPAQPPAPDVVRQATAFAEPQLTDEPNTRDTAPDVTEKDDGFEMTAIAVDPAQPALPSVDVPSTAFEMPAALPQGAPSEATPQTAEDQTPTIPDPAAPAPSEMATTPRQPVGPGPQAAQATQQPLQEPSVEATTPVGLVVAGEASAPDVAEATSLPAPDGREPASDEDSSRNAQVIAKLQVDAPRSVPPPDIAVPLPTPASAAPVLPATTSLPDIARTENAVNADTDQPEQVPTLIQTQEQAVTTTPAPPAIEVEVRVNRLPSLGEDEAAPQEEPAITDAVAVPEDAGENLSPMQRYSAAFDGADNKPMMAVVLLDEGVDLGAEGLGMDVLSALPYPVSFAIDPLLPDAVDRMAAYRAAGFEVLAAIDLPEGAQATDAEVTLSVALEKLPEVFAVLEGTQTGVQTTPMAGRQVVSILSQTGHGFVTQNSGLNTVQKLAVREGVPARTVFRDLDSDGQTEVVIRRFLDQAAFRAGQDGGVIMLGRLRPETMAALVSWSLQDRASTVAMAPASAVLLLD